MKYIINADFGGFAVPSEMQEKLSCSRYSDCYENRCNPDFIAWVQAHPQSDLRVVEIPDEATDWELNEYDGLESIIAVVDGKIRHIR